LPFDAVGDLVGRTPAACRQLASRARRSIRERDEAVPTEVDGATRAVVARFAAACAGGDLVGLMTVLDPSVEGDATVDGRHVGFAEGAEAVAERVLFFLGPRRGYVLELIPLEDGVGLLASRRGDPTAVLRIDVADGLVHHLHAVVLPG
jgi:RNA polymerase sigma-70 factor (ECF subfamily)